MNGVGFEMSGRPSVPKSPLGYDKYINRSIFPEPRCINELGFEMSGRTSVP